jgi:hypothetical protein
VGGLERVFNAYKVPIISNASRPVLPFLAETTGEDKFLYTMMKKGGLFDSKKREAYLFAWSAVYNSIAMIWENRYYYTD